MPKNRECFQSENISTNRLNLNFSRLKVFEKVDERNRSSWRSFPRFDEILCFDTSKINKKISFFSIKFGFLKFSVFIYFFFYFHFQIFYSDIHL